MVTHISLDLETWGTRPGADIRSIGACVFDPATGHVAQPDHAYIGTPGWFYFACDNPYYIGTCNQCYTVFDPHGDNCPQCGSNDLERERTWELTRDPRTVQWWSEQSDEAQAAFADPVDLRSALAMFTSWLYRVAGESGDSIAQRSDIRIWSHGASFDPPILAAAYEAVGLPVPWHYRAPRDTRTLFDMAGINDHTAWLKQHPGPLGVPHHALDDSICQARAVCAAYGRIGA